MTEKITIEIVGYKEMECSPFPCDAERSCGLDECAPTNALLPAVETLKKEIVAEFGESVEITLTLIDESVPDYIKEIYEREHPALPMILIQGRLVPIGRISLTPIVQAVRECMSSTIPN
jgi:hypothetical protein